MTEENNDYNKYLDVTRSIGKTRKESWDYVEKRMYAIATGALALSITLLSFTFDKVNGIHNKWLIITSWCCLVLSILVNFISHYTKRYIFVCYLSSFNSLLILKLLIIISYSIR